MDPIILTEDEKIWIQKEKQVDDLENQIKAVIIQATADRNIKLSEINAIDEKKNSDVALLQEQIDTLENN